MVPYLIWLACLQANVPGHPQINQACVNSLKAASIVTGVAESSRKAESRLQTYARSVVPQDMGAAAAVAYEVAIKHQVTTKFSGHPISDDVAVTGTPRSCTFSLSWRF
jgi:hypothetical protein